MWDDEVALSQHYWSCAESHCDKCDAYAKLRNQQSNARLQQENASLLRKVQQLESQNSKYRARLVDAEINRILSDRQIKTLMEALTMNQIANLPVELRQKIIDTYFH